MSNRLFALPVVKSDNLIKNKSNDWGTLKNKFSGKRLFKYSYFYLLNGDFSVLESSKNKWFLEQIIDYAGPKNDINLLPALKKIVAGTDFDESIRQRSVEILENQKSSPVQPEEQKIFNAKKILAGIRTPQTTEILRLLKDKSIESKRLAVFMIGKFKLTDMLPEVCECLNISGLEEDTTAVLRHFGGEAGNELRRYYLKSSGNINISRTILRLLSKNIIKENTAFLFERLWSNSRHIKEFAMNCLIDCGFKALEEDKNRLNQLISEVIGTLAWIISAKVGIRKNNNAIFLRAMEKEIIHWKEFLFNLLSITYASGDITTIRNNQRNNKADSNNFIPEMVDIIFNESKKSLLLPDFEYNEKKFKKFHRFFSSEIPEYHNLIEDLINRDYNLISIWTKACTLRSIPEIKGEDLGESVVALLFSPEEILQEEAAKLVARSGRELYRSASQRIPDLTKKRLDKIVSGETHEKELLFEKTKFISTIFKGIPEDELLFLAGAMKYLKNFKAEISPLPDSCIIWICFTDKADPEVIVSYDVHEGEFDRNRKDDENVFFYILSLDDVDAYHNFFPERSFEIIKYIDENEK